MAVDQQQQQEQEQVEVINQDIYTTSRSKAMMLKCVSGLVNACAKAQAPVVGLYDRAACHHVQIGPHLDGISVAAKGVQEGRVILHFHGGAHCLGNVWCTRELIGRLSAATKARVISVEYRLAPENPFPAALDDALAAWRWVCIEYPGVSVALAGDSAGGNLAFALLVKLAQLEEVQPAACVTMSPWLLLDHHQCLERSASCTLERSTTGIMKQVSEKFESEWSSGAAGCVGRYCQSHSPSNPLISPLLAGEDLVRRFPPVLIHASQGEPLAADAKDMAALCERCGVTAELELFPGSMHVFQAVPFMKEKNRVSLEKINLFLQQFWRPAGGDR